MPELKTKGFELFLLDSSDTSNEVRKIGEVTGITGLGGGGATEIDVTDFDSTAIEKLNGLENNGDVTLNLKFDPSNSAHTTLDGLVGGDNKRFFLGGSEAGTDPTYSSGYTLPTDRSSWDWTGPVKSNAFDFNVNDVVRSTVVIGVSGGITLTAAA